MKTSELFDLQATIARALFADSVHPWEVLPRIRAFILALGPSLPTAAFDHPAEGVWIAKSARIAPTAHLGGPLIVCEGAQVRHGAFIRECAIVGAGAVVGHATELKNCLLFDGAQAPHFNYVGDSILGRGAHMGAGAITSNVKGDGGLVRIHLKTGSVDTGMKKVGAMLGDFAEIGCNSVLNPGAIVGRHSRVYPLSSVRGVVPAHSIHKADGRIVRLDGR